MFKNRFTRVAVAMLALSAPAAAQVYVPSNTPNAGTCNSLPTNQTETRYQMIIDASYLPQSAFKITDVSFAPCGTFTAVFSQCEVRMTHTTLTTFAGNLNFVTNIGPCPTVLHSGPLTWNGVQDTWSPLGLTGSGFAYDGLGRNILVEFRWIRSSGSAASAHRDSVSPRMWSTGSGSYNATTGSTGSFAGAKLQLITSSGCVLTAPDTAKIGQSHPITASGLPAGEFGQLVAALGASTPINFGTCTAYIDPDNVFVYSFTIGAPIFNGYANLIPGAGRLIGQFSPPAIPALAGVCVYHAGVSIGQQGVSCCTNTASTMLIP